MEEFKFNIFGEIVDGETITDESAVDQYVLFLFKSNVGDFPLSEYGLRPNSLIDSIDVLGDIEKYITHCNEVFEADVNIPSNTYSVECVTYPDGKTIELKVRNTVTNTLLISNVVGTHTFSTITKELSEHRGFARNVLPYNNGTITLPYTSILVRQLIFVGEFSDDRIIKTKISIKNSFNLIDYITSICGTTNFFIHNLTFSTDNSVLSITENDISISTSSETQELTIEYILLDSSEVSKLSYSYVQEIPEMIVSTYTNTTIKNTNIKKNEEVLIQVRGF